jgi:hypothetical protein
VIEARISAVGFSLVIALLGLFLPSTAAAFDPCDPAEVSQTLQQAKAAPELRGCDREQILDGYLDRIAQLIENAELTEDYFGSDAEKTSLGAAVEVANEKSSVVEGTAENDAELGGRIDVLQQAGSELRTLLRTLDEDDIESAGRLALCQAELDWRLAKVWKQGLEDCPVEMSAADDDVDEPASEGEAENDGEDEPPVGSGPRFGPFNGPTSWLPFPCRDDQPCRVALELERQRRSYEPLHEREGRVRR